jgi:GTP-binding protein HflX
MKDTSRIKETAILIGVVTADQESRKVNEFLDELAFLVETAGGLPVKRFTQNLDYPDPRTFVGKGKLHEIREYVSEHEVDMAIFDDELSPSQIRNIEKVLECRILDRNNLILDIFARRAQTSHAKTQVELAQCEYLLPRLTRM